MSSTRNYIDVTDVGLLENMVLDKFGNKKYRETIIQNNSDGSTTKRVSTYNFRYILIECNISRNMKSLDVTLKELNDFLLKFFLDEEYEMAKDKKFSVKLSSNIRTYLFIDLKYCIIQQVYGTFNQIVEWFNDPFYSKEKDTPLFVLDVADFYKYINRCNENI